jgi:hypothetical protein
MLRKVGAQHRFVEGVTGLLRSGMSVHIDQAGEQPAAVGHGLGARDGILAKHSAVDPQRAFFALRQQNSAHMQHHGPCLPARPAGGQARAEPYGVLLGARQGPLEDTLSPGAT